MGKSKDLATLKSGLSIDGTLTTTSTGTNLTSNSYNVVKIQTDKDDNGSNDDAILQFTTGSSNTVKGELRYDESESMFEIGHGDNQGHIKIDSAGRVLTPARPAFHAKKSGSAAWQSLGGTSQVTIPLDSTNYNVGGHYNTSNYRFVAPVAGIYFFHAQIYHDANSYFQVRIKLNGNDRVFSQNREQGTTKSATISYQLAVNDYVEVTGLISNSDGSDWYSASTYSYFCGHLVG